MRPLRGPYKTLKRPLRASSIFPFPETDEKLPTIRNCLIASIVDCSHACPRQRSVEVNLEVLHKHLDEMGSNSGPPVAAHDGRPEPGFSKRCKGIC